MAQPDRGLKDYWFESGGKPAVLLEYLKSHALKDPEEYARDKTIALSELAGSSDVETLSDIGLLTQAGYLTIKSVEFGNTVFLIILIWKLNVQWLSFTPSIFWTERWQDK